MKRKPKKKRTRTPAECRRFLRDLVSQPLAAGVVTTEDLDRFAQRLAAAKADEQGKVMTNFFDFMSAQLETARLRLLQTLAAGNPRPN